MVVVSSSKFSLIFTFCTKYIVSGLLNKEIPTNCEVVICLVLNLSYK